MKQWHLAYTAPRTEKKVAERLQQSGIDYYLPLRKVLRQWSDRVKVVEEALFPSYIFIKADAKEYLLALNTQGILSYVKSDSKTVTISDKKMDDIRRMIENSPELELLQEKPKIGTRYTIPFGPLKGIEGLITGKKGKKHFILEVNEIGKYLVVPYIDFR